MGMLKPLDQIYGHDPDNNIVGDCFRTCIAMLLGCESPNDVPHFVKEAGGFDEHGWKAGGQEAFEKALAKYLEPMNLRFVDLPCEFKDLDQALDYQRQMSPNLVYMLTGKSSRGVNHAIICIGGAVYKDPAVSEGQSLIGPTDDGFFWISFLAFQPKIKVVCDA